jgi:hypothetical protein
VSERWWANDGLGNERGQRIICGEDSEAEGSGDVLFVYVVEGCASI